MQRWLPLELEEMILFHVEWRTLLTSVPFVCRHWHRILQDSRFWGKALALVGVDAVTNAAWLRLYRLGFNLPSFPDVGTVSSLSELSLLKHSFAMRNSPCRFDLTSDRQSLTLGETFTPTLTITNTSPTKSHFLYVGDVGKGQTVPDHHVYELGDCIKIYRTPDMVNGDLANSLPRYRTISWFRANPCEGVTTTHLETLNYSESMPEHVEIPPGQNITFQYKAKFLKCVNWGPSFEMQKDMAGKGVDLNPSFPRYLLLVNNQWAIFLEGAAGASSVLYLFGGVKCEFITPLLKINLSIPAPQTGKEDKEEWKFTKVEDVDCGELFDFNRMETWSVWAQ
jgi:hypothetical protein